MYHSFPISRRGFLRTAASLTLGHGLARPMQAAEPPSLHARPLRPSTQDRKPLAVVCTVYSPLSHAYHIAARFLHGYVRKGRLHVPKHYVSSLYVDQTPPDDLAPQMSRDFDIRLSRTVADALTLGGNQLAVDGVLLIGEHGNYPLNEKGQVLYPRYELLEAIVAVFRKAGQVVPVFCDKHLSYSWDKAKQMYGWAQELKIPFLAGSSLPVTWRRPELELPLETPMEDALVAAHGGVEGYGFHALEALQCMVERRRGRESGVKAVTCLAGDEVWKAGDAGRWSWSLLEAALGRSETINPGDIRRNVLLPGRQRSRTGPVAFLVEYRDGLRGTILLLNGHIQDFCFAAQIPQADEPASCLFYLPAPPGARYFDGQVAAIEQLLATRRAPYPVERTLLTTGILAAAMDSRHQHGQRVLTPELGISYRAPADSGFSRGSVAARARNDS